MNAINVIKPYKYLTHWVFDDEKVGLVQEPFIAGADDIINQAVKDIPDADSGFLLMFSSSPFPGYQLEFTWLREENDGNWYFAEKLGMEGWLCPALLKYFDKAPEKIYAQFKAI